MFKRKVFRIVALILLSCLLFTMVGCSSNSYEFQLGDKIGKDDDDDDKKFDFDFEIGKDKDKDKNDDFAAVVPSEPTVASKQVKSSISEYFSMSSEAQELVDSIIKESSEEVQISHNFEKQHGDSLVVTEIESGEGYKVLKIEAPNMVKILEGISVEDINTNSFSDMETFIKYQILDALQYGRYEMVTNTVRVNIVKNLYGEEVIERTNEYLDAIYGGLLTYYTEYMEELERRMSE